MPTPNLGIPLPTQATSPPDVVAWLTNGFTEVDTILGTGNKSIRVAAATASDNPLRRDAVRYGPFGSLPATLPPGTVYLGWDV